MRLIDAFFKLIRVKIMNRKLILTLTEISSKLKKQDFFKLINNGGCGHFIHMIVNEIKIINAKYKPYKIKFKIKVVLECGINHVFLELTELDKFYDCNGVVDSQEEYTEYGYSISTITYTKLKYKNIEDNWNYMFPRESLPIIKDIIEKSFQKNFS